MGNGSNLTLEANWRCSVLGSLDKLRSATGLARLHAWSACVDAGEQRFGDVYRGSRASVEDAKLLAGESYSVTPGEVYQGYVNQINDARSRIDALMVHGGNRGWGDEHLQQSVRAGLKRSVLGPVVTCNTVQVFARCFAATVDKEPREPSWLGKEQSRKGEKEEFLVRSASF